MPDSSCPDRQQLVALHRGTLPEPAAEPILEHLSECPTCRGELETFDRADDTLQERLRQSAPADPEPYQDESHCRQAVRGMESMASLLCESAVPEGMTQLGEYELLEKIGQGGMGAVYMARQTKLDRIVALKVLPKSRMDDPGTVARFEREMKAVGRLNHPNIVQALDAREIDGNSFLVMEYVEGLDLSDLVKFLGPLPVAEACELTRQAAVGLQYAHQNGLVHRDIKPSNIMLSLPPSARGAGGEGFEPCVKILDLGLALLDEMHAPGTEELTSTGQMMGTLDYMAPEQGSDSHQVDIRADIYSLGATLYKLLTGRTPFGGERYDTPVKKMMALATEDPDPIDSLRPEIPAELAAVVHRMLARDPDDRFATPAEVAEALSPLSLRERAGVRAATNTDLAALLTRGIEEPQVDIAPAKRSTSTAPHASSALHNTSSEVSPAPVAATPPRRRVPWKPLIAAVSLAGIILLGVLLTFQTDKGTLIVEIDDQAIEAKIAADSLTIKDLKSGRTYTIQPGGTRLPTGQYGLVVRDDAGLQVDTPEFTLRRDEKVTVRVFVKAESGERKAGRREPPPATAPLDADSAREHQQAWADRLGLPLEWTNSMGMEFVLIPPGEFVMGSPEAERQASMEDAKAFNDTMRISGILGEEPQHRVKITRPFYLGKHEVTQAQWEALMGGNPSQFKAPANPVEMVSWDDVQPFLAKLNTAGTLRVPSTKTASAASEIKYSLPTEAQWEYACRAGTTTVYSFGDDPAMLAEYAWCHSNARREAHFVGQKKPNAWGAHDLHGNVWEWCSDWWAPDYYGQSPPSDPMGPPTGERRVLRGGAYGYPDELRAAHRRHFHPATRAEYVGFRVVGEIQRLPPDQDRLAAEWALGIGANVGTNLGRSTAIAELPDEPFQVTAITFCVFGNDREAVDDQSIGHLAGLQHLGVLELNGTSITDAGLKHLGSVTSLKHLNLYSTRVSDAGLAELQRLPNLKQLMLDKTRVTDAGLRHLKKLSGLERLDLCGTGVTPAGIADLRAALPDCWIRHETLIEITPEPLPFEAGKALPLALVPEPARIAGVRSWSLDTRNLRGDVMCMACSPDGRVLATGGYFGQVRLWDAQTGRLLRILMGHTVAIYDVSWSPCGRFVASGGHDRTLRIWAVDRGLLLKTLRTDYYFNALAWSPDGRLIAANAAEGNVNLWDVASGETVGVLRGHEGEVKALAWSPDGKTLVSAGDDGSVRFWDPGDGHLRHTFLHSQVCAGSVWKLCWSPDGKTLVAAGATHGSPEEVVQLIEADTYRLLKTFPASSNHAYPPCPAWSQDGKLCVGSYFDVSIWETTTGELLGKQHFKPTEMSAVRDVVLIPGTDAVVVAGGRGTLRSWKSVDAFRESKLPLPAYGFSPPYLDWKTSAVSDNGKVLVTTSYTGVVQFWAAENGNCINRISVPQWHMDKPCALSADGSHFVAPADHRIATVWDVRSGERLQELELGSAIRRLSWSPDGRVVAVGIDNVRLWEPASGRVLRQLPVSGKGPLAWSPDGTMLVAGGDDSRLSLFEVKSGKLVNTCPVQDVQHLVWLDNHRIAAKDGEDHSHVWDVPSNEVAQADDLDASTFSTSAATQYNVHRNAIRPQRLADGQSPPTILALPDKQYALIGSEGHFTGSPGVEKELVYVVQTDEGQETLTPEEFANKYGWKNDPAKVSMTVDGGELKAESGKPKAE